jgi:pimeloyl-ACP methyl ester carboxylesterase
MTARGLMLTLLLGLAGCSTVPRHVSSNPTSSTCLACPVTPAQSIVFAVDGAGNFQGSSSSLKALCADDDIPLHIETYDWSHGYRRILADHRDQTHARNEAAKLAETIRCYQQQGPESALPVYILAHSSGCMVALCTAEHLPPNSIERIVLLAPSVSAKYDLRPALRCSRQGVEVFYSGRDRIWLGLGMRLLGTADGSRTATSGRVGFRVPAEGNEDACLYERLHQHPWDSSVSWTGHRGGHFSVHESAYLKSYVVPLLLPSLQPESLAPLQPEPASVEP